MTNSRVIIADVNVTGSANEHMFFFEECQVDLNRVHFDFTVPNSNDSNLLQSSAIHFGETSFTLTNSSFMQA